MSDVAAVRASELSACRNVSVVLSEQKKISLRWIWLQRSRNLSQ